MGEENLGAAGLIHNLCFHAGFGVRLEPDLWTNAIEAQIPDQM